MGSDEFKGLLKSNLTSLRPKLKAAYVAESESNTTRDRRWLNGFMAAGFHSGLVTLKDLKMEHLTAYRKAYGSRMPDEDVLQLERRLTRLCGS